MGAIGLLAGLGGVAIAAIPDSSGVIHGCYQKNNGNLRVVDSAGDCRNSERAIQWNQKGRRVPLERKVHPVLRDPAPARAG